MRGTGPNPKSALCIDTGNFCPIIDDVKVLVLRSEGEHCGTGAGLAEQFKGYREAPGGTPLHEFQIDDDPPDVAYPAKDSFRYIHGVCELYSEPRSRGPRLWTWAETLKYALSC